MYRAPCWTNRIPDLFSSFFLYHYSFSLPYIRGSSCARTRQTSPAPIERVSGSRRAFPRWKVPVGIHSSHHSLSRTFLLSLFLFFSSSIVASFSFFDPQPPAPLLGGALIVFFFRLVFLSSFLPYYLFISSQGLCSVTSLFWNRNRNPDTTWTRVQLDILFFSNPLSFSFFLESCSGRPVLFTNRHHGVVVASSKECLCCLSGWCEASCVPVTGV